MASFTDKIPQFNPYVSQQPVEAMVKVGMMKQQQYDTNLEKIYEAMSNVSGLPIIRETDKKYLEKLMNQTSDKLKVFASSDLSNNNITSHLKGMINNIAKDEIVQKSVYSSIAVQSAKKLQSKYTEEGKGSPSRDFMLDKQINEWMSNPNPGASFNGTYKPYEDYNKPAREIVKSLAADYTDNPVMFDYDNNGNIIGVRDAMTNVIIEGITPEKIQSALQAQLTPAMWEQMQIDGIYQYSGVSDEAFIKSTRDRYNTIISNYEKEKIDLQKRADSSNTGIKADIDKQIKGIDNYLKIVKRQFNSIEKDLNSKNLDGAKAKLFTIDWMDNMSQSFSYTKIKTEITSNPYMETQLTKAKMRQESAIAYAKMQQTDYWNTVQSSQWQYEQTLKKEELAILKNQNNENEYGPLTFGLKREEVPPEKYILEAEKEIKKEIEDTEKAAQIIMQRHSINLKDLDTEIALAKDINSGMSIDKRNDLLSLSEKLDITQKKQNQLYKIQENAEKIHSTDISGYIPEEDNKSFLYKTDEGDEIVLNTTEIVEFFRKYSKPYSKNKIKDYDFTITPDDNEGTIALKKKKKVLNDIHKAYIIGAYNNPIYKNGQFFQTNGEEISIYDLANGINKIEYNIRETLNDNYDKKTKYIADEIKKRNTIFNPKGYPLTLKDAEAKQKFRSGVLGPLALRAKTSSLEGVAYTESEIQAYSPKVSHAIINSGEDKSITIYSEDQVQGMTIKLTDKDFNSLFPNGKYQFSPGEELYYNKYLPDLLDYVPPVTPVFDKNGDLLINPKTNKVVYKENEQSFWTSNTNGNYNSTLESAKYSKNNGYFYNVNLFDVSADILTTESPDTSEYVYLKLNIYDPYTNEKFYNITLDSKVHRTLIDEYLKNTFSDMSIWEMLPGNLGQTISQEEWNKRINFKKTGKK